MRAVSVRVAGYAARTAVRNVDAGQHTRPEVLARVLPQARVQHGDRNAPARDPALMKGVSTDEHWIRSLVQQVRRADAGSIL